MNRMFPATGSSFTKRGIVFTPAEPSFESEPSDFLEDLRLFATGWLGGLVFFGTLIA